ncbi:tyrosine-type recombinase/integrase [Ruminiclostridium josui]|uniref:tyrosine-type recombinase/integrase n=1 Tax=Ruminiclostridium josui TaxID=1499 RepID=UPI000467D1FB|nr:tyrosine-type recombinase/integrase [Ruminiclostridium josui]
MRMKMQQQAEQRSIEQAFEDFIRYCNVKNLAKDSIIFYENCYKSFTRFLPKESYVSNITLHTIQDYILWQKDKSISAIAVNSNLRGVRAFLYYCMKLGYLPKFSIELVKAEKKVKQVYTDSELQLLLKKPNVKHCSFTEYRDWVVINYALATGNRVSTIINLKNQDVDFENGYITLVRTKNKKQQVIPLSNTLSSILLEYLTYRKGEANDYLFCNSYGNQLADRSLQGSVARYNKSRGVMKTSIHLFRHTYAKKYLQAGGNVFQLQRLLGHSSLEIVKEYVSLFSEDLKLNYDRFNPLEQMVKSNSYIKLNP